MMKDPVCGMQLDETQAAVKTDYEGKTYFFCCAHCRRTFEADPQKYAALSPQAKAPGGGCHCH